MVSILIPAYNAEKTIHRCLNSVLGQTIADLEIIVVNDGSKDATLQILHEYAARDSRIVIVDQANSGVAVARNAGLQKATGEFILYVDADDWIEPNMLEHMLSLANDADIVFCANDTAEKPEDAKHTDTIEFEIWDQERQLLEFMKHKRMTGMLWNKLIRRSITEGCSFNPETGYGEDAEFLWQVLKKSQKMMVTNEILYHHVMDDNSISHLTFSEKKYSAIPMWETIIEEVEGDYPDLLPLAKERLMCAAVFSGYEMRKNKYQDKEQIRHIKEIVRTNLIVFLQSPNISKKMKLFAVGIMGGYYGKVTLIIPIYNTEKYLDKCLNSVIHQAYQNLEIILIDDGSKDSSAEIAKHYEKIDERVWLFQQENAGVSAARNAALELATGEYVLMVDSDDWIEPDMVSTLVENIQTTGADISCCQYDKMVRSDIGLLEKWEQRQALETFIVHQKINGSLVNKLIKRDILEGLQFDSSIRYGEDALFCWKTLLNARSLCITNRVLYHVVMHGDSASGGGSYKPIRKDCITVWCIISDEAAKIDESLGNMAKAQLGNMAFFSLYEMAVYKHEDQEQEQIFQMVLRSACGSMRDAKFIPHSEKIMASIYSYSIQLGNCLVSVKKKLRK